MWAVWNRHEQYNSNNNISAHVAYRKYNLRVRERKTENAKTKNGQKTSLNHLNTMDSLSCRTFNRFFYLQGTRAVMYVCTYVYVYRTVVHFRRLKLYTCPFFSFPFSNSSFVSPSPYDRTSRLIINSVLYNSCASFTRHEQVFDIFTCFHFLHIYIHIQSTNWLLCLSTSNYYQFSLNFSFEFSCAPDWISC